MKNKGTWIIVGIVATFVLLIAGIFVSTNNRAVSLEEQVFTADSDIQAQEKRRTDLYYVINTEYSGVIYANLKDNTIEDGTPFIQADTIDEAVDYMVSNGTAGLVIFWVAWVILIGAAVFGFCYFDNKWLED